MFERLQKFLFPKAGGRRQRPGLCRRIRLGALFPTESAEPRRGCVGGHVRAHTHTLPSRCAVQQKSRLRGGTLSFSIFVSLLRVMHAGQPSNTCTSLQSQTIRPACTLSYCMCVHGEGSPQCTGLRTVYLCSAKRTVKVSGLHIHAHVHGRSTCKCSDCP